MTTPVWATEAVHVVDHDPGWARRAEQYAGEVRALFGTWLTHPPVHIGSTAVPGLRAKPVIDLQAVSADPEMALRAVEDLAAARRWMFVPRELDERPWRWLFVRVDADATRRLAHLHLMAPGEQRWHDQLLFRDRLRGSAALRAGYVRVKERAAAEHPDDREAYGRAKTDVVLGVLTS